MKRSLVLVVAIALAAVACKKKEQVDTTGGGAGTATAAADAAMAAPTPDAAEAPPPPPPPKAIVTTLPADLKWTAFDEKAGMDKSGGFAVLWGDPQNGPNGLMIKLPAGNPGTPHTHTNTDFGVTVMGGPTHQQNGKEKAKPLPAGSFWSQPGGTPHTSACPGKAECLILVHFNDGKFDFAPATLDAKAERPKEYVEKRPPNFKYSPLMPDLKAKSPQIASAWGDSQSGPSGTFFKFPAGFASPAHTHTADYHAVVIKGTILNHTPDDKAPKELGPGAYFMQPGGVAHITACKKGSECLMYSYMTGKFDFQPSGDPAGGAAGGSAAGGSAAGGSAAGGSAAAGSAAK